jgi:hypothetical protein
LSKSAKPGSNPREVRIVSLVPSLTELVCELGLGAYLVGRTGFCIHPAEQLGNVQKLGGTKQVNEAELLALRPSHLIVNKDENELPLVERLRKDIPNVLVTHPIHVEDNFSLFQEFSKTFGSISGVSEAAEKLSQALQSALDECSQARCGFESESVLYLIWKKPWMSIASNTYIASMLRTVAWQSYTVPNQASVPLANVGAARYPILSDLEVLGTLAKRILLSSEPYRFQGRDAETLQTVVHQGSQTSVHVIDGEMCSWYGPRAIQGLKYLLQFRQSLQ